MRKRQPPERASPWPRIACLLAVAVAAWEPLPAVAQTVQNQAAAAEAGPCQLVPDARNPPERILRCGTALSVRAEHGASYRPLEQHGEEVPTALRVDGGGVEVEFHAGKGHRTFQILTPFAIAAVRGTKWIVDVTPTHTSTFVIAGTVAVRRPDSNAVVYLDPGQGVDLAAGTNPPIVKRWPEARVRALLARFGE